MSSFSKFLVTGPQVKLVSGTSQNQDEFEQCPNCKRILYYVPAAPKDDGGAGA